MAVALLPGCLNCFDDGDLEESYRAGQSNAREHNQREFDRGYEEGQALTFEDGWVAGDQAGYDAGYEAGYYGDFGYPWGASEGYVAGHVDGALDPGACGRGADAGHGEGGDAGYDAGFDEAYGPSFDESYALGYEDALADCGFRKATSNADPEEMQTCEARGYRRALDDDASREGRTAGKEDNPDFQAGFDDAYAPAFHIGVGDGEIDGFNDGFDDGYSTGYVDGYDVTFSVCYDSAWVEGFDAAYVDGYDTGLDVGWNEGYDEGWVDGANACDA